MIYQCITVLLYISMYRYIDTGRYTGPRLLYGKCSVNFKFYCGQTLYPNNYIDVLVCSVVSCARAQWL